MFSAILIINDMLVPQECLDCKYNFIGFVRSFILYFSDRPIDLLTFAKKAGISRIFGGNKDGRFDGSSLFQLMSWNMDAISAACANLRYLMRFPECSKVRF